MANDVKNYLNAEDLVVYEELSKFFGQVLISWEDGDAGTEVNAADGRVGNCRIAV